MKTTTIIGMICKAMVACLAVAGLGLYPFTSRAERRRRAYRVANGRVPFMTGC